MREWTLTARQRKRYTFYSKARRCRALAQFKEL